MGRLRWRPFLGTVRRLAGLPASGAEPVRAWEEPLVIPTYLIGEPAVLPIFYQGQAHQGAQGRVYPYRMLDELTDVKRDKTYKALYLENEYLKVCVLPELGGRIFFALDKTNNYDLFYRQHVIKPVLIGMLGAWISGGVEWCAMHHHRATTFMPVDYAVTADPDGGKTIWVGETELRHRMRWAVGVSLRPGKSYIQSTVRLSNRTPFENSFLYWANGSVSGNPNCQIIFPPGVELATHHHKREFSHWPVSNEKYGGNDYTAGVDVSWVKNHDHFTSFFAWDCQEDFMGAYDHAKQAGVVAIVDHNILPGKKIWTWGNDSHAKMWEKILTDADGPYVEPMIGAYSDNQPDYSWLRPYEGRVFTHHWYPLRQIGGVKNANLDAAVNLEVSPGNQVRIGVNASSARKGLRVVLQSDGRTVWQEKADIGPATPYAREIGLPAGVAADGLKVAVLTDDGKELIGYQPAPRKNPPLPEPVRPPLPLKDIKTVEELYLAGQRLEQFHSAASEPYPYYEEALRRDGGNCQVNTALGVLCCRRGMYAEAKEHLSAAVERVTKDYVRPRDGEAFYYMGVALRGMGENEAACAAFHKAAWCEAWTSAACYALAELSCLKGQYVEAMAFADRALALNGLNGKAVNLKAALLRRLGRLAEAEALADAALRLDPLDFWAGNEAYLARTGSRNAPPGKSPSAAGALDTLNAKMRDAAANYLELAADYGGAGLWEEAIDVLDRAVSAGGKPVDPLLNYCRAYYLAKAGGAQPAEPVKVSPQASSAYCFPFQLEAIEVLRDAARRNPLDAQAPYYLGNLLYDIQPEEALAAWEESARRDDSFHIVHRNLGLAYAQVRNDVARAVWELEKAIACNPREPRLYHEMDLLYEASGAAIEKRLALLQAHHDVVKQRDDSLQGEIILLLQTGRHDRAVELLGSRHFRVWEGGRGTVTLCIDARLSRGLAHLRGGKAAEALEDFQQALQPPPNVDVYAVGDRAAQIQHCIGAACEALGDKDRARAAFELAAASSHTSPEARAHQGFAMKALGRDQEAADLFAGLIQDAQSQLKEREGEDFFAKFGRRQSIPARQGEAHYLLGLGYLGQGDGDKAQAEFRKAMELNQGHLWAKHQLSVL